MGTSGFSNTEEILEGILTGQVPRQIRIFAAQGLLPISREDLFRLQAALTADPEDDIRKTAEDSLKNEDPVVLVRWLEDTDVTPIELDLLIRVVRDEPVWAAVAKHKNVSDETLCVLATNAPPMVQDILITNQVRILGCLEILDGLRSNSQVTKVVLRRVREFEEEFIEKVAASVNVAEDEDQSLFGEDEDEDTPSIGDTVATLKDIGGQIPSEEELPYLELGDPALDEAVERKGGGAFAKLVTMGVKEKMMIGMKGSREERGILINSRNRLVLRAVLASPKISDSEVEKFAASRSVADEVIRLIIANSRWMRRYGVIHAIVQNPKTPAQVALRLLPQLSPKDLKTLAKDRNAANVIRRKATEVAEAKAR